MRFTKWTAVRLLALGLKVTLVCRLRNDRMASRDWGVPVGYHEDSLVAMNWIQSAADGDCLPFLSNAWE